MATETREEMIVGHLDLVRHTVNRLSAELPSVVDRDDLYATGVVGLIKAVDRFDTGREVKFETYASCLIRGEIMESLRETDTASRSLRRKTREMGRVAAELSSRLQRAPRADEIAKAVGLSLAEYQEVARQLRNATVVSLEESVETDPQTEARALNADGVESNSQDDPAVRLERKELLHIVAQNLERLPNREQAVVTLYYTENLTLREIGELLGVTESRVCQLHAQALRRLKHSVTEDLEQAA